MTTPGTTELLEFENFAGTLADASAEITLQYFRSHIEIENKAAGQAFDPVTIADRQAEDVMRTLIAAKYPHHGIVGEEQRNKMGEDAYTWVLDPIDGTRSYIAGIPLWGTLIALGTDNRPFLGVMDQPVLGDRYIGVNTSDRREARLMTRDGRCQTLRTRTCSALSEAVITCTTPQMFAKGPERAAYEAVEGKCRLARYSLDCTGYALLSMGMFDLVIESGLAPYDIQALIPLVQAAGGVVTDWRGNAASNGGQILAAGTHALHEQAMEILRPAAI